MLLDRPGSGCSGSSVVAEARGITVGLPKPSTPSPGSFPTTDFVFTPYGRVGGTSGLAPGNGKPSSALPSPKSTRPGSVPAPR